MFMKAILYNKEDDLHFLLKCLVEKIEDDLLLKQEEDDDDFFDPKSRADDKLEETIFSEDSLQDLVEQDALKESKFDEIKEEDFIGEGKDAKKVKAKVMNKLTTGFYADAKRAIEAEQKKSPTPLTRQQKEKITFDLREKAYKKFINEGEPLEIKLKNTSYKWTVDEIKDTWKEFTADRDRELRRQQYVKDKAELQSKKQMLDSFDSKTLSLLREAQQDGKINLLSTMLVSERIGNVYDIIDDSDENIELFNYYKKKLGDATTKFNTYNSALIREEKRGMIKKYPKGTPERKIIDGYFKQRKKLTDKITTLNHESLELFEKFVKDQKKLQKEAEKLDNKIKETTEKIKDLDNGIDKKLPKDAEGKPIWVAEFKLTDEEKKEYQDRIKELEAKTEQDEEFFKEIQMSSKKVSPLQVMQADKELAGLAKTLKTLLEEEAVKNYLRGKKSPLESKVLTAYMKGSYTDDKLRAFLETDAKKDKKIRDKARGKRIPLGDGASLKKEAYRRIYNYILLLTKKVAEKTDKPSIKRAIQDITNKLKQHDEKLFRDLDSQERKKFGAASRFTRAAYSTLASSLKNMKEISDRKDTSDNKRMLEAKKVLENEKYGMTLMRDLMNIAMGQKLEKPPKKQKRDSKEPSETSKLQNEIKELKEKIEQLKNKDKNMEEMKEYFNLQDELPKKVKELREKIKGAKGKTSGAKKKEKYVEGTPADLRSKQLKKAEAGEKTGLNAFRFFDVNRVGKTYVLEERETPLDSKDKNYQDIEKFANQIKDILSDNKIMSAIEKTYSKLTGGVVFGQDKASAEKRKELSDALESLKPFISERRKLKKILRPIPDFLIKEMIKDEEKLSKEFLSLLKFLEEIQIVDVSNILVNKNKLISNKNKIDGLGGNPYYNIFNKPVVLPLDELENKLGELFITETKYDKDSEVKLIRETRDKLSKNPQSFLRDYWNVVIKKMKDDMDKLGSIYESDPKEGAYAEQGKKKLDGTRIAREFQAIHNPMSKRKKAFDEFFLALDEKQDGKAFFKEVEDLIKSIIKLQKEYTTKKTKQKDKLDLNKVAREYAIEAIRRIDKVIDDKEITEPSQDTLSEEESKKETERLTVQLKPLQDKLKEMRKDDEADEEELSNLIQEIKKLKQEIDQLKAKQNVKTSFGNKTYRFTSPIPISVDSGKAIIMGALEPLASQKMADSIQGLFETDIDDSVLIEALKKQFLNYFKQNEEKIKQIGLEQEVDIVLDNLMLDQIKDEFEDLIKTFKSKKTVIDMSKVEFDINDTNLRKLLTDASVGKELAKLAKTDLTDIYDSYVKRLNKMKEIHVKNTEKAKEISKDLIETIGTLEEDSPTYKTKEGDEEE